MAAPRGIAVEDLPAEALRRLVGELLGEVARLRAANAALREEIARPKGLSGRPEIRPSRAWRGRRRGQGRGVAGGGTEGAATATEVVVHEERVLATAAPPGSRCKGYEDVVVRELRPAPRVIRSRRQRWPTPDGRTLVAPLPAGGGRRPLRAGAAPPRARAAPSGAGHGRADHGTPGRRRAHHLQAPGGAAVDDRRRSKRQVVRLSTTAGSAALVAEAAAVRRAGLETARRLTVDDTAAPAIGPPTG